MVSAEDRGRLEAIVADRNRAQKHVARARIILASAGRLPVAEVARRAGVGRPAVWRWQARFVDTGVAGLLHDATRKVALTSGEATHWTGRAMAETVRISLRSVQRIWAAHDLQPHRIRTFKHSNAPDFAAKLADIVGLYVDPPKHAIVLSVDEKWLGRHPRWVFHFTPTSGSWLNAVETLLLGAHPPPHPPRQLPLDRRPAGRDQPLHRRAQRRSQTHLRQLGQARRRETARHPVRQRWSWQLSASVDAIESLPQSARRYPMCTSVA